VRWAADSQNPGLYGALLATVHLMLFAILVRLYSATKNTRLSFSDADGIHVNAWRPRF